VHRQGRYWITEASYEPEFSFDIVPSALGSDLGLQLNDFVGASTTWARQRDTTLRQLRDPWRVRRGTQRRIAFAQAYGRVEETGVRLVAKTEVASFKRLESSTIRLVQVTLKR
jgi:hypothetical protein